MARSKLAKESAASLSTSTVIPGSQMVDCDNAKAIAAQRVVNLGKMEELGRQNARSLLDAYTLFAGLVRDKVEAIGAADDYATAWLRGRGEPATKDSIRTTASKFKGFADEA